jgi:hypothetical protein
LFKRQYDKESELKGDSSALYFSKCLLIYALLSKLNEAAETVQDTLNMLKISLPVGVFGLRPLAESQQIL